MMLKNYCITMVSKHTESLQAHINAIISYEISSEQIFFMSLIYFQQYRDLYQWWHLVQKVNKIDTVFVNQLHAKGIIKKPWKSAVDPYPDGVLLTRKGEKIIENIYGLSSEFKAEDENKRKLVVIFTDELFENYPTYFETGSGEKLNLKACKRIEHNNVFYEGRDQIGELYAQMINYDEEKHRDVINRLKFAVKHDHKIIAQAISRFVLNRNWNDVNMDDRGESDWYELT